MKRIQQYKAVDSNKVGGWCFSASYGIISSPLGEAKTLEPRLAKLMYYLSLNANTYVSRDYLVDNIWKETIVNKDSLTRAVADLRKILSIHYSDSLEIETLRKRGYRLNLNIKKRIPRYRLKINPAISNGILGMIVFVILIWIMADLIGIVETKLINGNP